jgi:DNA polymerase-3 subunit delta'
MTWTVVGQEQAVNALVNAVTNGRVAHAYLFAGPAHVGKTHTALQFAQMLNCTGAEPPCGRCDACERIAGGRHADVEIVTIGGLCRDSAHDHARDNSRDIRICQIRRLEDVVSRAPFTGRCRVLIIDPADAMNETTQNALLKTLEEPPANVVLVLVTDHEEMLLPTIRSRARRLQFGGMTRDAIERVLRTRWDADPTRASHLARLARGRLGWAVLAMHDDQVVERRKALLDAAQQFVSAGLPERLAFAAELGGRYTRDRAGTQATLEAWEEIWRDIMLIAAGRPQQAVHRERLDSLRPLAAQCDVPAAVRALRAIGDARGQLAENASPALALETMMLDLPVLRPNPVSERLAGR